MRSPLWVESECLCAYSVGTKGLTWVFLCFLFLRLLTGCYTLALLDSCHMTVDCLLQASSAAALWVHGKLTYKSFGFTPSICLATGTVNLYTVINPPVCSDKYWVPCGSLGLWGSGPSRWGHPFGVESEYVLDRIEGSSLNLCFKILHDGSSVGRVFVPWYSLDRIERFLGFVGSKFLQDGAALLGSSLLLGLDRNWRYFLVWAYGSILQSLLHCSMLGRVCYI